MSSILHRQLGSKPLTAVAAQDGHISGADGRDYLDACTGAAVSIFGHSHPRLIAAATEQMSKLDFVHSGHFTSDSHERLGQALVAASEGDFSRAMILSSGTDAIEAALKLARQHFVEKGEPGRTRFITRRQSYHGNSLGALSVGGNMSRRAIYEPLLFEVSMIGDCNAYRRRAEDESEEAFGLRAARELDTELRNLPKGSVIAFIAETMVGATSGAVPPPPGYLAEIRRICDDHGILLILDEIMCGFGRTGELFAYRPDGIAPDIVTLGKGLGGGVMPVSAVLVSDKVIAPIHAGTGRVAGGQTFMGHPVACAIGCAALEMASDPAFLNGVRKTGQALVKALQSHMGQHPHVGDIRGRGLMWAVELVDDREGKRPFPPAARISERIKDAAFADGLLVYPGHGTIDGVHGDHILIAPMAFTTAEDLERIAVGLSKAIDTAVAGLGGAK